MIGPICVYVSFCVGSRVISEMLQDLQVKMSCDLTSTICVGEMVACVETDIEMHNFTTRTCFYRSLLTTKAHEFRRPVTIQDDVASVCSSAFGSTKSSNCHLESGGIHRRHVDASVGTPDCRNPLKAFFMSQLVVGVQVRGHSCGQLLELFVLFCKDSSAQEPPLEV